MAKKPMNVQSLIFDKGKFKDAAAAKKWAKDHDFSSDKVDETGGSFRLRQKAPSGFDKFRTIELTEGVKAVVAKSEPGSSDVHVSVPLGSDAEELGRKIKKAINKILKAAVKKDVPPEHDITTVGPKVGDPEDVEKKRKLLEDDDAEEEEGEEEETEKEGLDIDLGSGQERADGHVGFDLYPHDDATVVHDLSLGIPLPDESVKSVRMVNSLHHMEDVDPKALMSEIQRVLMPGGQFHYEGPNQIYNYPEFMDPNEVEKTASGFKQVATRLAIPDAATANDAEPRTGIAQFDSLPADVLLAVDALGYYYSDAATSGIGNRAHGYPSQGALVSKESRIVPISKVDRKKQIVYGVVLEPDSVDEQGDTMTAQDIENTAHEYMRKSRVVGDRHSKQLDAYPVESYIAPQDMVFEIGTYGPQVVKQGSWVLGVKVNDPAMWQKVEDGEYTGFSIGGFGKRTPVEEAV